MARRNSSELVTSTLRSKRTLNWYEALLQDDRSYVLEVIDAAHKVGAPIRPVAAELIKELGLSVSAQTVAKFISEQL